MTLGKRGLSPDASIPYITQSEADALRSALVEPNVEPGTDPPPAEVMREIDLQLVLTGEVEYEVTSEDPITVKLTYVGTDTPARPRATRRAMTQPQDR